MVNIDLHYLTTLRYTLALSGYPDACIDIPPQYSSLNSYRVTLGHKANHSHRNNAVYVAYTSHPVLGHIAAVMAKKRIPAGAEVFSNYNYNPIKYKQLGLRLNENECHKVNFFGTL